MAYLSRLSGEMAFSRKLTIPEAKLVQDVLDLSGDWGYYQLAIEVRAGETREEAATYYRAYGLELKDDEEIKAYRWKERLQDVINVLPDDVKVDGYFERVGEENPDLERLYVIRGMVTSVTPEIVWPNEGRIVVDELDVCGHCYGHCHD